MVLSREKELDKNSSARLDSALPIAKKARSSNQSQIGIRDVDVSSPCENPLLEKYIFYELQNLSDARETYLRTRAKVAVVPCKPWSISFEKKAVSKSMPKYSCKLLSLTGEFYAMSGTYEDAKKKFDAVLPFRKQIVDIVGVKGKSWTSKNAQGFDLVPEVGFAVFPIQFSGDSWKSLQPTFLPISELACFEGFDFAFVARLGMCEAKTATWWVAILLVEA